MRSDDPEETDPGDNTEALSDFWAQDESIEPISHSSRNAHRPLSGWLIGAICGVLIGLWALPPVRYTLWSQLQFALASDGAPWTHPLDAQHTPAEIALLDAASTSDEQDYLLQVGRATALADSGGLRQDLSHTSVVPQNQTPDDRILLRLTLLAANFPNHPGSCAHLTRYMMVNRVRLQRLELTPDGKRTDLRRETDGPRSIYAAHRDVRLMEWALRRGEKLTPDNAFWPAMLASTYFAAGRDQQGLRELAQVVHTSSWDAYVYEQVLGQWRLYSRAYGDHGAAQKVEPLSLVAFPQLREMRHMGELARWLADRAEAEGHDGEAIRIRHDLARLGQVMRDTAPWAYEALYGTELLLIASTDGTVSPAVNHIRSVQEWQSQSRQYIELLTRNRRYSELTWITQQVQQSCALRLAVDQARSDASLPGLPPGIPLAPLFGDWMMGICLIQQMMALSVAALVAAFWSRWGFAVPARLIRLVRAALLATTFACGSLLALDVSTPGLALIFLSGMVLFLLTAIRKWMERHPTWRGDNRIQGRDRVEQLEEAEQDWDAATTARVLILSLPLCLLALYLLQPTLARMHPVAMLLTHLMNPMKTPGIGDALKGALLAGALPLVLALVAGGLGVAHRITPLYAVNVGLRRMTLPTLACLTVVYLALMQRTLRLDALCSRAINEAARNDRQWVLTHSEPDAPGDEGN